MSIVEAELYNITDEDIHYCEWITRELYRQRYQRLPDEDEMQDCMLGMCEAAEVYNESKGTKFPSWARVHIFKAMQVGRTGRKRKNGSPVKPDMYIMGKWESFVDDYRPKRKVTEEESILNCIAVDEVLALLPPKLSEATIRHYINGETYTSMYKEYGYSSGSSMATVLGERRKEIRTLLGGDDA